MEVSTIFYTFTAALKAFPKTCQGVQAAVALLIDSELWGFTTPANVKADIIQTAAAKVQPYYAVPTKILTMDAFPHTA